MQRDRSPGLRGNVERRPMLLASRAPGPPACTLAACWDLAVGSGERTQRTETPLPACPETLPFKTEEAESEK